MYDKAFEVKKVQKITLSEPLVRWEIQVANAKYFNRFKLSLPIVAGQLLKPEFLTLLANDAVNIYKISVKAQQMNLSELSTHEKRVVAEMDHTNVKKDLKIHNKETFKRDMRIFRQIMTNKNICINDDTEEIIQNKFKKLIES